MNISAIITVHNEGDELARTVKSIRDNTTAKVEIVVVDDASTDRAVENVQVERVIRHSTKIGIGHSRQAGSNAATGDVFMYFDGHHRVTQDCVDKCAALAMERRAIVWPCVRGLKDGGWTGHGARLKLEGSEKKRGLFAPRWNRQKPFDAISRCACLFVPGYAMPREVYDIVHWIDGCRSFGANEPMIAVKAFFADIDILHLCGPMARHMFRKGKIPLCGTLEPRCLE